MITPALASILRSGSSEFNQRFSAARRIYPDLNPNAFSEFLETLLDSLVRTLESSDTSKLADVVMVGYDAGLVLVGQKLAGPNARQPLINLGWHEIFPAIASLTVSDPGRIIPSVCNAIYQLASTSGGRPTQWIELMRSIGPQCTDVDTFLRLGQVASWRSGLAHYRDSALHVAASLPSDLLVALLEANDGWEDVRSRLESDVWFNPAADQETSKMRVVARVGTFRGFGGLFVSPPFVASAGGNFLARCQDDCWLLTADAFGATFHRASVAEFDAARSQHPIPEALSITGSRIALNGQSINLPDAESITSAAVNDSTLAITSRLSHSIVLIALGQNHEK